MGAQPYRGIDDKINFNPQAVTRIPVVVSDRLRFALVCLAEGQQVEKHAAPGEAIVHVLSGQAVVEADMEDHKVEEGDVLHVQPETLMGIRALKDTVLAVFIATSSRQA